MNFSSVCMVVWLCSHITAVSECKEFFSSSGLYLDLNSLDHKYLAEVTVSSKKRIREFSFLVEWHCVSTSTSS